MEWVHPLMYLQNLLNVVRRAEDERTARQNLLNFFVRRQMAMGSDADEAREREAQRKGEAPWSMSPEDEAKIAAWVKEAAGDLPDGEFEDTGPLMGFRIPGWDLR